MREALILAGGRGTRLGKLTDAVPKPLIEVGGEPFLEHILWNLERYGVRHVVLSVGYLAEAFDRFLCERPTSKLTVEIVAEEQPMGTGGAVALAARRLTGDVALVLNGDTVFDVNYLDLELMVRPETPVAIALMRAEEAGRFGTVILEDGCITRFLEKASTGPGLISGGVYAATADYLQALPQGVYSLETDVFPELAAEGRLAGHVYGGAFVDMGTPESLAEAEHRIERWRRRPAVLFDRDGVLNVDFGHVSTPERFEWIPGAPEAVKMVNDAGALAIVVTNQAGIAKGMYTAEEYAAFESWIDERLAEFGAHLDATYHCPHHPAGQGDYGVVCDCRKPAPGMVLAAMSDWSLDRRNAVLLGDKGSDLEAAVAAGIPAVLYEGGDLRDTVSELLRKLAVRQ